MNNDLICENLSVSQNGGLLFNGQSTKDLAEKYGTPLYLMDEDLIAKRCRTYLQSVKKAFGEKAKVYYASKAASFKRMYEIMKAEGMKVDVVSLGELCTALKAGFPVEDICFHSNNKTDRDIEFAISKGVGRFVVDNTEELLAIDKFAGKYGVKQKVIIRITPGIDPHTYEAVATGKVDSKFGFAIETGQADEIIKLALTLNNICLLGFHSHVGSQVFDGEVYIKTADVMLTFIKDIYQKYSFMAKELDLGGGFGVRYLSSDPVLNIEKSINEVADFMKNKVKELGIDMPFISFEPGRSIVADAGMTLYSVGSVKKIEGYKNYVSVDGGMGDNIRYALYGAKYTVLAALKLKQKRDLKCSVVGRYCESGDVIADDIMLPSSLTRGDIIAVLTTGAYNYSMASNYNRVPRPAVVMVNKNGSYVAVRRETEEDVSSLDV